MSTVSDLNPYESPTSLTPVIDRQYAISHRIGAVLYWLFAAGFCVWLMLIASEFQPHQFFYPPGALALILMALPTAGFTLLGVGLWRGDGRLNKVGIVMILPSLIVLGIALVSRFS